MYASFPYNNLESLDDDLFEFNQKLKYLNFNSNKLKYVGENLMSNLTDLKSCEFHNNPYINVIAQYTSQFPALVQKFNSQCKWPRASVLIQEIELLKAKNTNQANLMTAHEIQHRKNEDLIRQLNATIGEMQTRLDLQAKVVTSFQEKITKMERWLKSCDGNLNSATEILFKTTDHQQVFTQASSEQLDLIVEFDGSNFTASELIIGSPGSMVRFFKYANGPDADNEATELRIDHQQTLFLPTNLGQHFPALQALAVTSSGLMHIDSSVFGLMNNLKVLNLTSNKLQEIQPSTFDQLKLLESLDLSSNNLKTLETSAIIGLDKLQVLNLAGNRLKSISSNIFEPLKVLQTVDLSNNDCISLSFPQMTLKEIGDQIIKDCTASVELECFMLGPDYNGVEEIREEDFDCVAVDLTIKHPNTRKRRWEFELSKRNIFSLVNY